MRHLTTPEFWQCYRNLPLETQELANSRYALMMRNPRHPSLHLKKVGRYWSVRIGLRYRTLAIQSDAELVWFWIGTHAEYDHLVG